MRHILLLSFAFFTAMAGTANLSLPPDTQAILDSLPEKKITLPLVVVKAHQFSDQYKLTEAQGARIPVPTLSAEAPLDVEFYLEGNWLDNRNEPTNVFSPQQTRTHTFKAGASTYFSSGTKLGAEISHGKQDLDFLSVTDSSNRESRATLTLSQNLWQDAFGKATRLLQKAGALETESLKANYEKSIEEWLDGIKALYYDSWFAQASTIAAEKNVELRLRLLNTTKTKIERGTAEKPDLLQVHSAHLKAKAMQTQAQERLNDRWRSLVVVLKFPEAWLKVNPQNIPLELDHPFQEAAQLCGTEKKPGTLPEFSSSVKQATLFAEALQNRLEAMENRSAPKLELMAGLISNGVDPSQIGSTITETLNVTHPAWSLGVRLSIPLFNSAAQRDIHQTRAEWIQAEAHSSISKSEHQLDWLQACSSFKQEQEAHALFEEAFKNQSQRAQLEEKRFGIGRVDTLKVIQAGDDATQSELDLRQSEIQRRVAAWQVLRVANQYKNFLKTALQKKELR